MTKKRILMISPVPTHPQTAGNRARIYNLALSIKQFGHELYFAHVDYEPGDRDAMVACWGADFFTSVPYTRIPDKLFFRIGRKMMCLMDKDARYLSHVDGRYDASIDEVLKKLSRRIHFDVVIVEYVFFSKALICFPDSVFKVIDTHDVMTNRHKLYLQNGKEYGWFSTTAALERKGLRRADIIVAIQEGERNFFSRLTQKQTITVGHMVKTRKQENKRLARSDILFIGSNNQSNIDAITVFIDDMFPIIKRAVPDATLFIAGPVCRAVNNPGEHIVRLGESLDLDTIYDKADVVINPIRFGTGLKIKNIEALGYSKPLVTTSVGAEGMENGVSSAFLVGDDVQRFSDAVIEILCEPTLFNKLEKYGYDFAVAWNQKQTAALQVILNADPSAFRN